MDLVNECVFKSSVPLMCLGVARVLMLEDLCHQYLTHQHQKLRNVLYCAN